MKPPVESEGALGHAPGPVRREVMFAVPATFADVSRLGAALQAFGVAPVGGAGECNIDIGVIEALNNIVEHGYSGGADAIVVVSVHEYADRVVVELIDHGRPLPADRLSEADANAFRFDPAELGEIPEGGMGLALINTIFDAVEYSSIAGENRLRLTKITTAVAATPTAG